MTITKNSNLEFSNDIDDAAAMYTAGNIVEAFHKYKILAEKGVESCQSFVGWLYMYGQGVERDYGEAIYWLTPPANNGDKKSQYDLGVSYVLSGEVDSGLSWLNKAALQDYSPAFARLGGLYDLGRYVDHDPDKAFDYYRRAHLLGHLLGRREYAVKLMKGYEGFTGRIRGLWLFFTKLFIAISIVRGNPFSERGYI